MALFTSNCSLCRHVKMQFVLVNRNSFIDLHYQTILPNYNIRDSNVNLRGSCIVTEERLHECEEGFCALFLLHTVLFKRKN